MEVFDPVEASDFGGGLLLSCFTTAKITFTSILYPQFMYMIYINVCTSLSSYNGPGIN